MFRDFNASAHPAAQAILFSLKVLGFVILLAVLWEFGIEDSLRALAADGVQAETLEQHFHYVITISAFTSVALVAPTYTLYRYIERRDHDEHQVRHMATHDGLTDIPNRSLTFDRLEQSIAQAHRHGAKLAVLFIDLDGFKGVNDLLGHDAGDYVLITVASRLTSLLRETDTVGRFGGDEFVSIVTDIKDIRKIDTIITKLKREIALPMSFEGKSITLEASVGCAIYPDQSHIADELVSLADRAMYVDKNRTPNPVMHAPLDT